jgi:Nucleotidyl transferase AbiEii toxin, Type IV TA system
MNPAYDQVLSAGEETRAGLFTTTALRLGSTPQNVEKDFWVCWTLDALFNGLPDGGPRLLFKGGTSLSKGFGLIRRFSEDIDVTVFRDDLKVNATVEELQNLSRKKRTAKLDEIAAACEAYIQGSLLKDLTAIAAATAALTGLPRDRLQVRLDEDDKQTLLVWYPAASPVDPYVRPAIKIESGAKSALDPNTLRIIRPYVGDDAPGLDLAVANVTTVVPKRTFWDKVVILHGLRRWYEKRGELRGDGQRISRHYYDIHRLMESDVGRRALLDRELGADCVAHARMFFNRPDYDLASAQPPSFAVLPHDGMVDALRRDYRAMTAMIFGPAPEFDLVLNSIARLETLLNAPEAPQI